MTKDEAYKEAIRRWRELPLMERQTYDQAQVFAASLADQLDFRTMGNERKVIAAWLVRDIEKTHEAAEKIGGKPSTAKPSNTPVSAKTTPAQPPK